MKGLTVIVVLFACFAYDISYNNGDDPLACVPLGDLLIARGFARLAFREPDAVHDLTREKRYLFVSFSSMRRFFWKASSVLPASTGWNSP